MKIKFASRINFKVFKRDIQLCLFLLLIPCIFSCHDFEEEATESLLGNWYVNEAWVTFGPAPNAQDSVWRFEGAVGNFLFDSKSVTYQYLQDDLKQTGQSPYVLTKERVRQGFVRETKLQLQLSDSEYEITFGDNSRNSHRKASEMTMINLKVDLFPDIHSTIILYLNKN
ncbi:hypothetical protein [Arthrospiribacter ruber]|uniref:Uncharacterized protein n=1 Tax=Arthrospiribacter ruber TaxID=2487934 RepID=A0A951MD93_9BACT|nr:hypothetical protein [Arthrospiribacter ruber]MBW3468327.1 hypothetical protein [Arthrospiribacter ruber]